jgi:hypothetical protein
MTLSQSIHQRSLFAVFALFGLDGNQAENYDGINPLADETQLRDSFTAPSEHSSSHRTHGSAAEKSLKARPLEWWAMLRRCECGTSRAEIDTHPARIDRTRKHFE